MGIGTIFVEISNSIFNSGSLSHDKATRICGDMNGIKKKLKMYNSTPSNHMKSK